ncbi:PAAR-like domain-containing protein [Pantoea vagans]|uniref:PAAR-like domain-containing protein n=1 Tax=Pantoea vagans TaxID=470934 RepID=UPI003018416D
MADNYASRKDGKYVVVGLKPDMCMTPGIAQPVPYPVMSTLSPAKSTVSSVRLNGNPAVVYDMSFIPITVGDAAGSNKGVVSGTVEGDCWPLEHSPDTFIGGHPLTRVQDLWAMNGKAPGGRGGRISKKEAWLRRQALIARGRQSHDPAVRKAADRLAQNNTGIEKARLAEYVYEPRNPDRATPAIPEGWTDISDDPQALARYGLKPKDLQIKGEPNFKARVYSPDKNVFGDGMSATVVFRGTRNGTDWKNNLEQGTGFNSDYYNQAVTIGTYVKDSTAPVDIAGHSLGGGLASAASRASGQPGWTFNAAGLKPDTVEKYGGSVVTPKDTENITAYRVNGEILTAVQEPGFWTRAGMIASMAATGSSLVGTLRMTIPVGVGTHHDLGGGTGSKLSRHGMDQVLHCIELEKQEDESVLTSQ